ncbi:MAG TPA: LPS export ABC transporter periplasmic protein LptC [Thermoanaerobaculia bacterium]|nr:LPS export ABC transporter periplasmic protein LptC [Thermoanaerobaculia bacterium]
MARRPTNIRRLRTLLLLALVLTVVAVVGLFLFGRAGRPTKPKPVEEDTQAGEGVTLVGEDFDFTFTERERPIFRIRGDSIRADREDTLFLDGVGVTFYDENRQPYHVESKEASFNRTNNEGRLQGDVVLRGPSNLELRTAQLQIRENGKLLMMPQPVEVHYATAYIITGDKMRVDLKDEVFVLNGNARINSVPGADPPVLGTAERAVYQRKQRLLRIEGNANLRRGRQRLAAQRITAFLTPEESGLTFLRALWDVSGQTADLREGSPGSTLVTFKGKDLAVMLRPEGGQVRKVDLDGTPRDLATLETSGDGVVRNLAATRLEGILAEGVLSEAEALGGVELEETTRAGKSASGQREVRKASGRRAEATFRPDGQLANLSLLHEVTFEDPQVKASGNRASLDLEAHRGELFGQPVELDSDKGHLQAPHVVYDTENKIVNAQGGVRGVLTQVAAQDLAGSPLAEGEGPVHVDSREAFWRQQPSSFIFRGDVKAWRGENLMLSTELKGEPDAHRLTATGGVKTIWIPEEGAGKAGSAPPAPQKGNGTGAQRGAPIEVRASDLLYLEGQRIVTYTGGVRVEQQGTTLNCQKLDVTMNEEKKPQQMTCTGAAKLNDPKGGRQIEGETAVYRLDQRNVEFTGEKVTMKDREGNVVQGRRMLYLIDTGKVEVKGKGQGQPPAPAPTPTPAPTGAGG